MIWFPVTIRLRPQRCAPAVRGDGAADADTRLSCILLLKYVEMTCALKRCWWVSIFLFGLGAGPVLCGLV